MRINFFGAFLVLISISTSLLGAEQELLTDCNVSPGAEVQAFAKHAFVSHFMCSTTALEYRATGDFNQHNVCVNKALEQMKACFYPAALKSFAENKAGIDILKDVYSYWDTTMGILIPENGERELGYNRRILDRETGLKERLKRLQLEK